MYMCSYIMLRTDSMKAIYLLILLIHTCSLYAESWVEAIIR